MEMMQSPEEQMYEFIDKMRMNRTSILVKEKEREDLSAKVNSILENTGDTAEECVKSVLALEELRLKKEAASIEIRKLILENSALHSSVEDMKSKVKLPEAKDFSKQEDEWFSQGDEIADDFAGTAVKAIGKAKGGQLEALPTNEDEIDNWLEQAA